MKAKRILTLLIGITFSLSIQAQDHGFSYQAVARNTNGSIMAQTELDIEINIRSGAPDGTIVWIESQTVQTNKFGLFTMSICTGDHMVAGGTASSPEDIDWGNGTYFLEVIIDTGNGQQSLGASQILSVPLAEYAKNGPDSDPENEIQQLNIDGRRISISGSNSIYLPDDGDTDDSNEIQALSYSSGILSLSGDPENTTVNLPSEISSRAGWTRNNDTVSYTGSVAIGTENPKQSMLAVQGNDLASEEPLFVVNRKDGNPVFAVYNEGVQVYVNEDATKGIKGGFAVGGYNRNKGTDVEYLRVTPDSVRVYINTDDTGKGIKGGFAVGGYNRAKGLNDEQFFNISSENSVDIISPSEPRLLWYPKKNAFLSGQVLINSSDSVGQNSMASGYENKASGDYSQALGYKSVSEGTYSTAIGRKAFAGGLNSIAIGDSAQATGANAYAFGNKSTANGDRSFAFGSWGEGDIGGLHYVTRTEGESSMALGIASVATGDNSFAIGSYGYSTVDPYPMPMFSSNEANGNFSMSLGFGNHTEGVYSVSIGRANHVNSGSSVGIGYRNAVNGEYSIAGGHTAVTLGDYSIAMGYKTVAKDDYSFIAGSLNDTTLTGVRFAVGDGYRFLNMDTRRNAFTVYSSGSAYVRNNLGLGIANPSYSIHASGSAMLAAGNGYYMSSTSTGVYESSGDLYVTADDDLYLRPDDDIYISRDGGSTWGIFDNGYSRLGLGTTTPTQRLDVVGNIEVTGNLMMTTGSNRYISFPDQSNTLFLGGTQNAYRSAPYAISFITNDASNYGRVRMTIIGSSGNVGIGTTSPGTYKLYVAGTTLSSGGYATSDRRYKTDITDIEEALSILSKIDGVSFTWKKDKYPEMAFEDGKHYGMIAQEVQKVLPEMVKEGPDGKLAVAYTEMIPILLEGMKEQQAQIEEKDRQLEDLEKRVERLEKLLAK